MEAQDSCNPDKEIVSELTSVPEPTIGEQPKENVVEPTQEVPESIQIELPRVALIACACGNSCTFKQDSFVLVRTIYGDNNHFDILWPLYACINCHRQWFACNGKIYPFEPAKVVGKLSPEGSQ